MDTCTGGHEAAATVRDHNMAPSMCALDKACQLSVFVAAHVAQQAQHGQQLIDVEGPFADRVLHFLHQIARDLSPSWCQWPFTIYSWKQRHALCIHNRPAWLLAFSQPCTIQADGEVYGKDVQQKFLSPITFHQHAPKFVGCYENVLLVVLTTTSLTRSEAEGSCFMPSSCRTAVCAVNAAGSSKAKGVRLSLSRRKRRSGGSSRVLLATGTRGTLCSSLCCAVFSPCSTTPAI